VRFDVGEGEQKRSLAFLTTVGGDKDDYQGIQMNLAPQQENMSLYYAPAGSMSGMVGETPVRIFDDNLDGIYGSAPVAYQHLGCTTGSYAPEMDSILVGSGKRARPWSEFQQIGTAWYRMTTKNGGTALEASQAEVETGTMKLKFKGGKPSWMIVKGIGKYEQCYYDLVSGGSKGTSVPTGTWSLYYGELREGKKAQMIKTLILPGQNTPTWTVEAGKTTEVELGGPFGFDFKFEQSGDRAYVKGDTIVVVGAASERYERAWGCVPRPEVSWREKGSKKESKPEKMHLLQSQEDITEAGWAAAWFPRDLELELDGEDPVEVRLFEKKNKLFGKVESVWKD
jgi:hypothetical protein